MNDTTISLLTADMRALADALTEARAENARLREENERKDAQIAEYEAASKAELARLEEISETQARIGELLRNLVGTQRKEAKP